MKPGIQPVTPLSVFLLFMDEIIDYSVRFTNIEARRVVTAYNRQNREKLYWKKISRDRMNAFIGLNIGLLLGVYRSRQLDLESIWSDRDGLPVFHATMTCQRFKRIKRFFRLDDRTRLDQNDSLYPVRDVWELFTKSVNLVHLQPNLQWMHNLLLGYHGVFDFLSTSQANLADMG